MGIIDQASMMASLAKLKNAKNEKGVIEWFKSNPWVYTTIKEIISTVSNKFGILSCDKTINGNDIAFVIRTEDSAKIYSGIRELVKANLAMLSKFKVKFTVDILNETDIGIYLSIIPGKTDSFLELLEMIEKGTKET